MPKLFTGKLETLYSYDAPALRFVLVPSWIESDIYATQIAAVIHGGRIDKLGQGCASGAYMPAVTYLEALETMDSHGNDVLDSLNHWRGYDAAKGLSWDEVSRQLDDDDRMLKAVEWLSLAVELWCHSIAMKLEEGIVAHYETAYPENRSSVASLGASQC